LRSSQPSARPPMLALIPKLRANGNKLHGRLIAFRSMPAIVVRREQS
jgi:hypothetical protein